MKKLIALFALGSVAALAQDPAIAAMKKHWNISKTFTLAVANAMPDANYSFKATPEEMSFGEMVVHIAQGNGSYCSRASGMKSPIAKPATIDKASAMKVVAQSFDFCLEALSGTTDLNKMMGREGSQSAVGELFMGGFTHTAHHRGQLEVYLRLKGIKPPDYQF